MGIQINGQTDTISATDGSFTISGASGNLTGNLTGDVTGNVTGNLTGNVTSSGISTFSDTVNVGAGKSIRLYGATSGYSEIIAAAGSASTTFTLPANGGSASQYLQTDGSGGLSWAAGTEYQGPAFHAYKSGGSTTSLTASTWTKVTLDAETFDTDGNFDSTTNYRFTPTKAGYYVVTGQVFTNWSSTQWSQSQVAIYKNGSEASRNHRLVSTGTADYGGQLAHHIIAMNGSTDYLELYYWSNAVGPTYNQGSSNTWFFSYWVHD